MRTALALVGVFALAGASCTRGPAPRVLRTVRIPVLSPVSTLDPAFAPGSGWDSQVGHVYEGLFQYDYRGRPYSIEPALAESVPQPSADGRTYLIAVRPGILFQDDPSFAATGGRGRELTASDVVFSLKRIADPLLESPHWRFFRGRIAGLDEWRSKAAESKAVAYEEAVEGLEAVDRYTLRITLNAPYAHLLHALAHPAGYVVPVEAVKHYGREFAWNPVGTGPFRLSREESSPDRKVVWIRNPTYAAREVPLLDRLEYEVFSDARAMWESLLGGTIDLAPVVRGLDVELAGGVQGLRLERSPAPAVSYFALNLADPVLGRNRTLREALGAAYDAEFEINRVYDGRAIPAAGPIPPDLPGYDPGPRRDPGPRIKEARRLLEKAGFPGGKGLPVFQIATATGDPRGVLAENFATQLRGIGVRVEVLQYGRRELKRVLAEGAASIWMGTWDAEIPDAEEVLRLFHGKSIPGYDRVFERAAATLDPAERARLHRKLAGAAVSHRAWIFGVHPVSYVAVRERVRNFVPHQFDLGRAKYYEAPAAGSR